MVRKAGAVLAGVVTLGVVVFALQALAARLHPLPPGIDPLDPANADALRAHTQNMPATSWALAFGSEVLGALLGGLVAGLVAGTRPRLFAGAIVALALAGSIMNWTSFPHPTWYIVGQLVGYPLAFLLAVRVLTSTKAEAAQQD